MDRKREEFDILEFSKVLWTKRRRVLKGVLIAACVGLIVGFSVPKSYMSSALVVPEIKSSTSKTGLSSLAYFAGINVGSASVGITELVYSDIVSSVPFVFEFAELQVPIGDKDEVREVSLLQYFTEEQKSPWWNKILFFPIKCLGWVKDLIIPDDEEDGEEDYFNIKELNRKQNRYLKAFQEAVVFEFDTNSLMGTLVVKTQSPDISLMLADSVLLKLQEYISLYKTSKARMELESNSSMLNEARRNYYRADSIYAAASDSKRNIANSVARISLDRLFNEKNLTYSIYSQLASQVELDKAKLNEMTPILTVIEPARRPLDGSPSIISYFILYIFLGTLIVAGIEFFKIAYGNKNIDK